ncbi:MAG TPA: carbamoyltransferase HypF, partial [Methanobacterium sp.]|nr:carbamoyltransferase HypF [Methanobacterium sp.]
MTVREVLKLSKARILVQGIVQGVGFRPTVYRIAQDLKLHGYVRNLGNIVEIVLEGNEDGINRFSRNLKHKNPPISKITSLKIEWIESEGKEEFQDFRILESSSNFSGSSVIPPDVATCDKCLKEVTNPHDRRYGYPFTACTDCGPRFTVINSVPYDRERTSMDQFPLCPVCMKEYNNPEDRRYHAEATCCPVCGPSVFLYKDGVLECEDPIKEAVHLIDDGNILAVKGIGGTHLVSQTTADKAVKELRRRLGRFNQPFACMSPSLDVVKSFAEVSTMEEETLRSRNRPIVVLNKSREYYLSSYVAPDLHNLGIMLPYSALHHLLFKYSNEPAYIMTSANMPGEPMLTENHEIINRLDGVADYYLLHNRKIINRCDDSVVRFRGDDMAFIRRSRGYVPEPYDFSYLESDLKVLALGPEIDVTFSILKEGKCYVSQHIGDTTKYETFKYLKKAVNYLMGITKTDTMDVVACDLHPMFFTTKLAQELSERFDCDVMGVQHHYAHAASLALDNNVDEFVCIAADGVGYGEDGTAWGGEILHYHGSEYERTASLMPQKMVGGDITTRYPARMIISMLYDHMDPDELSNLMYDDYISQFKHGSKEIDLIIRQLERSFNVSTTTSTGRVLDAISTLLHICGKRTYEGECAMKLESVGRKGKNSPEIPVEIRKYQGRSVLDTSSILLSVLDRVKSGEKIT